MSSTIAPRVRPRSSWSWPRRLVWALLALLAALALVATALVVWSVRRPFPQVEGELALPALDGPVDVYRDEFGVAHLYATTSEDLYRAQGYVHAQERFWQMDVWRHIGAGRTAELLGPAGLESDRFLRTLGWERVAREELALMQPETKDMLAAYTEGVNAYLQDRPAGALGLEYTVLGLQQPEYVPAPWEPVHALTFLKLMAWDLRTNLEDELQRGILSATLSETELAALYPPYPADAPRITAAGGEADGDAQAAAALGPTVATSLGRVSRHLAGVEPLVGPRPDGVGSNSWVVSGEHTATGMPLLANDPHQSIQAPSIWYQIGLHCVERSPGCAEDMVGFSFAGVPGVVIGHNDRIAWGFTNLGADVMDLYVERINPDDPDQYEVDGQWVDMEVQEETLRAADGTIETLRIRSTRNGPIISDTYGPVDRYQPAGDLDTGEAHAIALRWTALDPGTTIDALPALNRARDWDDFREAAGLFQVPAQNLVYADVDGNIGYQAPGRIPIRDTGDGRLPAPGWDSRYTWSGFIPFEELPSEFNPERGWIVTANNAIAAADYPYLLTSDWDYGYRAARIEQLLAEAGDGITVEQMVTLQSDVHDGSADWLVPALLVVDDGDERVRQAQDLLADWEGGAAADSPAAAVYAATWRHLLVDTFGERLPEGAKPGGGSRWFEVVRTLLDDPANPWWGEQGRDQALADAMAAGVDEVRERLGSDPAQWRWGDLHTATFRNGTLGESGVSLIEGRFNRGPYPVGGGSSIVNATSWNATNGYEVTAAPSLRMVVDLADLDRSRAVHAPGQSGHAYHRHYQDLVAPWQAGGTAPMHWSREAVEQAADTHLRLLPS